MYCLKSEDLTHLGGPMGTEYVTTNYLKYFLTIKDAKAFAEKDYQKLHGYYKIEWHENGDRASTQDLGFVMYHISKVKVEK